MLTTQSPPSDVSIPTPDGLVLRGWHWARPNPRGVVVVSHGFGEHGGCYRHVAEALGPALEVDFVAPDLRGHGRSPGRRGVVGRYEELTSDLRAVLAWAESERPGLPRFVLGHSNGGQVALRLALEDGDGPAGLILSNPSLQVVVPVPRYKLRIGRFLLRVCAGGDPGGQGRRRLDDPRPGDAARAPARHAATQPDQRPAVLRDGRRRPAHRGDVPGRSASRSSCCSAAPTPSSIRTPRDGSSRALGSTRKDVDRLSRDAPRAAQRTRPRARLRRRGELARGAVIGGWDERGI